MSDPDCVFCKIVAGDLPAAFVYQDDVIVAFRDIHPVAPTHVLVIPRKHVASLAEAGPEDEALLGRLMLGIRRVALDLGIVARGYRTILNTGPGAGQSVFHLHAHVLSGRRFSWP